jgi:hypothetical protein
MRTTIETAAPVATFRCWDSVARGSKWWWVILVCSACHGATIDIGDQRFGRLFVRDVSVSAATDAWRPDEITEPQSRPWTAPAEFEGLTTPISITGTVDPAALNGPYGAGILEVLATFRADTPVRIAAALGPVHRVLTVPAGQYIDLSLALRRYYPLGSEPREMLPLSVSVTSIADVQVDRLAYRPWFVYTIPEPSAIMLAVIGALICLIRPSIG